MGDHDRGYRLLFQHPEMVEDLLRGFVHESWVDDLDFSSLQHLPEIHVSDKLHRRETDMVWRLRYRGEDWLYVYILLEFQSTVDPFMALRVLVYVSLLAQRLQRQGLLVKRKLLPPILPLVLYNGDVEWTSAREVSELFVEMPVELARYQPRMPYLLIDEQRLRRSDLESLRNLAAALFRQEQSQGPTEMFQVTDALAEWLQDRSDLLEAFLAWIGHVLLPRRVPDVELREKVPTLEELRAMLQEKTHKTWAEMWQEDAEKKGLAKGMRKGIRKGRLQGRVELLETLLESKFGTLDETTRSRLHEATSEDLLRWGTRVLKAERLDEVFS